MSHRASRIARLAVAATLFGAAAILVVRGDEVMAARAYTVPQPGDHIYVFCRAGDEPRALVADLAVADDHRLLELVLLLVVLDEQVDADAHPDPFDAGDAVVERVVGELMRSAV